MRCGRDCGDRPRMDWQGARLRADGGGGQRMHVLERSIVRWHQGGVDADRGEAGARGRAAPVCLPKSGVSLPLTLGLGPSLHEICDRLESVIV
jgi:hypothetical protein